MKATVLTLKASAVAAISNLPSRPTSMIIRAKPAASTRN